MSRRFATALRPEKHGLIASAVVGSLLLVAWASWFNFGRVSLYAVSQSARVEVDTAPNPVDAPVAGRVVSSNLILGAVVAAGDVLVQLDAEALAIELSKEAARVALLEPQIAALRREFSEDEQAARGEGVAASAAREEAEALSRALEAIAALKRAETSQLETLRQQRIVAELESTRMRSEAEQRAAEAEAARTGVRRLGGETIVRRSDRRARLARLELEIAQLESMRGDTQGRMRTLSRELDLRTIRAPVAGRLGDVRALRAGAVVDAGMRLAVVVPAGGLRAVAFFDPEAAVGRVVPGQKGRLRLLGFPWTKFGALAVTVENVGTEPAAGLVRVELAVARESGITAPFEHGLPGIVDVRVERASPWSLVLDAAGRFVTRADAHAEPLPSAESAPRVLR